MTKEEWLVCTDPQKMLDFLRGKASDRKLRLFAVACCRHNWHLLTDDRSRRAVDVAESYADGVASDFDLTASCQANNAIAQEIIARKDGHPYPAIAMITAVGGTASTNKPSGFHDWAENVSGWAATASWTGVVTPLPSKIRFDEAPPAAVAIRTTERAKQAVFLHELFGNPFHPVTLDPAWLAWNDGTVVKLAQAIYDERAFDDMPILSDALQDAGCNNTDILSHCRQPGEHVRGCWIVDLLLGKS